MKFKMKPGGGEIEGESYADVVRAMADQKMEPITDIPRYRHATARRVLDMTGNTIRTDKNEHFVKDLVSAGLLEEV